MPARPLLRLASTLALLAAGASGAAAQEVRGRILADADGSPLAGAYVVLVDGADSVVARTLSTVGGAFSLGAPRPGRYVVRAEHIGFGTASARVTFEPGEAAVVELRAPVHAIELEGLVAEVDRECRVDPRVGARVVALWEEVGKAFQVTAFVEERGAYLMETARWRRRLEPERLRVEEEERREASGFHAGSPFVSLEPASLAEDGYIRGDPVQGHRYFGPDARVLLSRSFQATHCFGFTDEPPDDGEPGWVGIRFQPRDRSDMDIMGTLWIESATYEPRRLDFRYARLPYPLQTDAVGGRIEFTRIPQGPWIVHRWRIRVPLARSRRVQLTAQATPQVRYDLAAVVEHGGEVLRVKPFDGREYVVLGRLGRLEGTVRQTTGSPVAGASVLLEGTALRTRADAGGRFVLRGVPAGLYTAAWSSPALDSLDLPGASREVEVRPGETSTLDAVLPPPDVAVAERCTGFLEEEGTGVLRGRVSAPGGAVPEGTVVQVRWEVVDRLATSRSGRVVVSSMAGGGRPVGRRDAAAGRNVTIQGSTVTASLPVEPNGAWMVCGVPEREELTVWAQVAAGEDERSGEPVRATLRRGEIRAVELGLRPPPR